MAKIAEPFSLYKRKVGKSKVVYYAKLRGADGRPDQKRISTGQTSKASARLWVEKYLENEASKAKQKELARLNVTFAELANDFWEHDGAYAEDRRARRRSISKGYLDDRKSLTLNHLLPKWGECRLRDITTEKVNSWVLDLADGDKIANSTVNMRLKTFRVMLEFACTLGHIKENPAKFVTPIAEDFKRKGVLTIEEVKRLLNPSIWSEFKHFVINLLTLSTGIRMGEVRGLQVHQIHEDYIEVHTSWEEGYGLKEPKLGSMRDIPITKVVYTALQSVIETTEATHLVFYGASKETPISKNAVSNNLYKALAQIGIDEVQRRQRNLTFHSHRHTLNTIMRSEGIPDAKIRMITGHRQESMTERYTNFRKNDIEDITQLQSKITKGFLE